MPPGELVVLLKMTDTTGLRPSIDRTLPLDEIHKGFQPMIDEQVVIRESAS
jgi:hypothetical protein